MVEASLTLAFTFCSETTAIFCLSPLTVSSFEVRKNRNPRSQILKLRFSTSCRQSGWRVALLRFDESDTRCVGLPQSSKIKIMNLQPIEKFFKRKSVDSAAEQDSNPTTKICDKRSSVDLNNLPSDPGLRPKISDYHPNDQEEIRRAYIQKGPCQPIMKEFPQREISGVLRRFQSDWYKLYGN
ncbi:uncharacterized protein LOC130753866 [Actinidia eriantha]|uniref:uncharacterized protein LOC130753866 n=1 Tax=Actinidia eriantha TaxID=165200 RepID=UPI00258AD1E7|nr:uncharacterized protein LOC130753866 [Actinidia eriantha]